MKPTPLDLYPGYVFCEETHQRRLAREHQRRLDTARAICERLRQWYALPYEAVEAVAEVLEAEGR